MFRGRSRLVLLVLLALVAGAWLFLSTTAGRGASTRVDASVPAAGRAEERADLRLAEPRLPEPAARGREEVSTPAAEEAPQASTAEVLELAPGEGLLQIRVIAIGTGKPLAGVALRLELLGVGEGAAHGRQELVSNDQGRVDCRVRADADCQLTLAREGAPALRWRVRPVPPREYRTVVVQLFARTDLLWHARALDEASGAPLPDALVALVEGDPLNDPRFLFLSGAEADGTLRLEVDSSRKNLVRVEAPGHATRVLEIRPGHERRAAAELVELSIASALEVYVTDARGLPLADLELTVSCPRAELIVEAEPDAPRNADDPTWHARTSPEGWARVDELPPRVTLTLQVDAAGKPVHQALLDGGLEPGRAATLRVRLGPGRTLAGRAQLSDGRPCAHVALWLLPAQSKRHLDRFMQEQVFQHTVSDAEGRFRFEDVPAGRWFVGPEPDG